MGESVIKDFLESLEQGDFEVKTDRFRNGNMAVELYQNPRRQLDQDQNQVWVPSGLNITTAKWWVYQFTLGESFIVVSVERLRRFINMNSHDFNENTFTPFAPKSDNPAMGFILKPHHIIEMMISPKYDELPGG
jgi:hypothetical protein